MSLKNWMKNHGWTYVSLGAEVGCAHSTLLRIANGEAMPRRKLLRRLHDVTGLSIEEILSPDLTSGPDEAA